MFVSLRLIGLADRFQRDIERRGGKNGDRLIGIRGGETGQDSDSEPRKNADDPFPHNRPVL